MSDGQQRTLINFIKTVKISGNSPLLIATYDGDQQIQIEHSVPAEDIVKGVMQYYIDGILMESFDQFTAPAEAIEKNGYALSDNSDLPIVTIKNPLTESQQSQLANELLSIYPQKLMLKFVNTAGSTEKFLWKPTITEVLDKISEHFIAQTVSKPLTEDTRTGLISKSRNQGDYKQTDHGKNRFERKKYSKVANSVKLFNQIDMNDFFKHDRLTVKIPVIGETDNYTVSVRMEGIVAEIAKNIKNNQNKFEFKTVIQALTKIFNTGDIYVNCTCDDYKFNFEH